MTAFAYVDRIAIAESESRDQGWGPALYHDFQAWAVANDRPRLAAEVNTQPPNPRSLRFHEIFGFDEVAALPSLRSRRGGRHGHQGTRGHGNRR
ncbi:MAG: hypothetical protein R2710_10080 [Acidimicrobiales bacterium]